jgi:nucleoside-diphosphate-sugar epimerase
MKVFLTGATGFIGCHVARALAIEGAVLAARALEERSCHLS